MRERAINWSIVFASMGIANSLGAIMRQSCFSLITERMVLRVRMAAFTTIMRQNIGWFDGSADHTVRAARAQNLSHLGRCHLRRPSTSLCRRARSSPSCRPIATSCAPSRASARRWPSRSSWSLSPASTFRSPRRGSSRSA
eukprot:363541-Prymnesium_polylepis.2